jgi:hypothetical protein
VQAPRASSAAETRDARATPATVPVRRQPAEIDTWRLPALNHVLDAAGLLPAIGKACAAER